MAAPLEMHEDRLLPSDPAQRAVARALYAQVRDLPILSPHGHSDPAWYGDNIAFPDPSRLLIIPDHYLLRMLYSQGVPLERLGVPRRDGGPVEEDPRAVWRLFAQHYHLFRGTPSRLWLDYVLYYLFGVRQRLGPDTAEAIYDQIAGCLARPEFRVRELFRRFHIEVLATTDSPLSDLEAHQRIAASGWPGRVLPTFRPDPLVDPEAPGFGQNLEHLARLTGQDTSRWPGYLRALAQRRQFFIAHGATATDHGHPSAKTCDLPPADCQRLLDQALRGEMSPAQAEAFRGQMLLEMAKMSLEDGLVMQLHPGSWRNHNRLLYQRFGPDMGADIPTPTNYVRDLKPLLDRLGNEPGLTLILFTLDESAYSRELAPLAGHYPILRLGPAWWFYDSPQGMLRHKRRMIETAGFYNTVGFNDDTRAFASIPARHDLSRRLDCAYLAELVCDHCLAEDEAAELAGELAYGLAKRAYRL